MGFLLDCEIGSLNEENYVKFTSSAYLNQAGFKCSKIADVVECRENFKIKASYLLREMGYRLNSFLRWVSLFDLFMD